MVIGYQDPKSLFESQKYVIAGGFAGAVTRGLTQPLDVIKIRFQLQVEPFKGCQSGKYKGLYQAVSCIVKEEGLGALWKGHVPAQCLSIVYGCVQFATFEKASKQISTLGPSWRFAPWSDFICGVVGSSAATVISFPFDVIRTRLVAQGNVERIYTGTTKAFVYILTKERLTTLFRGLTPTLIQVAPQGGIQFTVYNGLSHLFLFSSHLSTIDDPLDHRPHLTPTGSLIAGSISGVVAKIAIYPLDLAKKRLQIQGFDQPRRQFGETLACRNLLDCIIKTYQKESVFGLFKGLFPSLLKAAFSTALHFSVYEQTLAFLNSIRKRN